MGRVLRAILGHTRQHVLIQHKTSGVLVSRSIDGCSTHRADDGVVHVRQHPGARQQPEHGISERTAHGVYEEVGREAQDALERHDHGRERLEQHRQHGVPSQQNDEGASVKYSRVRWRVVPVRLEEEPGTDVHKLYSSSIPVALWDRYTELILDALEDFSP